MMEPERVAADVVVLGYGGAGVCAAIEAASAGARVLVLERFAGGGATRASGGVVYAGGGTRSQRAAGFDDRVEHMLAYLQAEAAGDARQLRAFCERSAEDLEWLEAQGLRFPAVFCADKTVVPPAGVGLYYSGNEQRADPGSRAPRGHVPEGHGQRGRVLFDALDRAARARGVELRRRCLATRLLCDGQGRVVGVEARQLPGRGAGARLHALLCELARLARPAARILRAFERALGEPLRAEARGGVVIATGGFVYNPAMLARHAPGFLRALPLGTPGDDGAGISMAADVGAAVGCMDRCAAWRFLYPPEAFLGGLLVNRRGERFCDESLYGATVGRCISEQPGGRAYLIIDQAVLRVAERQSAADERLGDRGLDEILSGQANDLVFRKLSTWVNLHINRRRSATLSGLERACHLPAGSLERTVSGFNARLRAGQPDPFGKPDACRRPIEQGPFLAIGCELDSKLFLGPCFTLGGLRCDPESARVLREDGSPIPGLFAAGRCALGVSSGGYLSGLSVADCVFSGRNAGRSAARSAGARAQTGSRAPSGAPARPGAPPAADGPTVADCVFSGRNAGRSAARSAGARAQTGFRAPSGAPARPGAPPAADGPTILVTGGAGYLGRALLAELARSGDPKLRAARLRVLDRHSGRGDWPAALELVAGDILDAGSLGRAVQGADLVFHLAALVDWGQHPPEHVRAVNLEGTRRVVAACRASGVRGLVHVSSLDALWSGQPLHGADESCPYPERFDTAYCASKARAEQAVLEADGRGLRAIVMRPCSIWGGGDPYHLRPMLRSARFGLLPRVGTARMQCAYVGNVVHALLLAGRAALEGDDAACGQVYFVTDFEARSLCEQMAPMLRAAGVRLLPWTVPRAPLMAAARLVWHASRCLRPVLETRPVLTPSAVGQLYSDYTVDSDKAERLLGYRPRYSEQEAYAQAIGDLRAASERRAR
ncbi:MAG: FAD-binding protein [Deltaproteobacteria bacterium]|nr:FAD-binding protein [Deltaproteobacteria bacterium]